MTEQKSNEMVSVIITSLNEQLYLENTLKSVLDNARGEIEILCVLDGWLPNPMPALDDARIKYIFHEKPWGQRHSINAAAKVAQGKYIFKLDAHCAVGEGFDIILARDCEYDMTMIPAMFNLDVETWKPKFIEDWDLAVKRGKLNTNSLEES